MKSLSIIFLSTAMATFAFADEHEHRHHGAHVHGSAKLAIAFDQLEGQVEFRAASEGIIGFEHQAKSEKDKKTLEQTKAQFQNPEKLIQFDSKLGCKFQVDKIEMIADEDHEEHDKKKKAKHHGEHSDFVANYKVRCEKSVLGSSLTVDFSSFSRLKDLDITVLAGDLQKSAEAKKKPVTIELK